LTTTNHPRFEQHQTIRETTNQQAELEKTQFPAEEQLGPFHLTDTLRVVNIHNGATGNIYPTESATTTGQQQRAVITEDVRLRTNPMANRTRLVPSQESLDRRQQALREAGHTVILPINKGSYKDTPDGFPGRDDNPFVNGDPQNMPTSEASSAYAGPAGFAVQDLKTDLTVETKYRRGRSEFNGHDGAPELYNR
jgi:hypothetical protein